MESSVEQPILLLGTAAMGAAHAAVLRDALGQAFVSVGRDAGRTVAFAAREGAVAATSFAELDEARVAPSPFAIVATASAPLEAVTSRLLDLGCRAILVEKPGALDASGVLRLAAKARQTGSLVRVGCNRRFFGSVRRLAGHLASGATPRTATFDFTEWPDRVLAAGRPPAVLSRLAIANSIHVIDTVRHLLGPFERLDCRIEGRGTLPWHPAGAEFAGVARCGEVPVTWATSWRAPGRWAIEIATDRGRFRLAPMEELKLLRPGSLEWEGDGGGDEDDGFKPGLRRMLAAFDRLARGEACPDAAALPDLVDHAALLRSIETIAGYDV